MKLRVAVLGAGVAGLSCARTLDERGFEVTVLDKGRGVGGRLATRREPPHTFDLGAQYFTARDERLAPTLQGWLRDGVCAPWRGRIVALDATGGARAPTEPTERLVGTPGMSALGRDLATGLEVRLGRRVERIDRIGEHFALQGTVAPPGVTLAPARGDGGGAEDLGHYDALAICLPPSQAAPLLDGLSDELVAHARAVAFEPCVAVGLVAHDDDAALRALPFDGAFVGRPGSTTSPLAWIARDSSKPGRPPGERWVLHATGAWSEATRERPLEELTVELLTELARLLGAPPIRTSHTVARRWALARATAPLDEGALVDEAAAIGLAGDWTAGGRVEGAFLAGRDLGARLLAGE